MIEPKRARFYTAGNIDKLPQFRNLSEQQKFDIKVVSSVLPFRTNNYVVDELIDWDNIPDDPIFQLTFVQRGMLEDRHYDKIAGAISKEKSHSEIKQIANEIRYELNPHPAGQLTANVPLLDNEPVQGVQHKYKETALVFPSAGQTCHAYCTFCFRWAQFVGMNDLKFATDESHCFQDYLREHKEITDVLFTGGDPMIMNLKKLKVYLEPLLEPEFEHIRSIRIGTKSIAYWPYEYVTDNGADGILRLFEKIVSSGKHLAIMGHYNHHVELSTSVAKEAVRRIRNTGAEIRSQSPLIKHVNDDPDIWANMWQKQVDLGIIPYYFFVERDTGAKNYFGIPLERAFNIYRDAYLQVSGLARTVRGPSMSAAPGKVSILGITKINREKVFILTFLQGRNAEWCKNPFFAKFDPNAQWLTELKPAFGKEKFFYQDELNRILEESANKHHASYKSDEEEGMVV